MANEKYIPILPDKAGVKTRHVYDISLHELKLETQKLSQDPELMRASKRNADEYMEKVIMVMDNHKEEMGIGDERDVIVDSGSKQYPILLALKASVIDSSKISLLLSYHKKKFRGWQEIQKKDFRNLIEHRVLTDVARLPCYDKDRREEKIIRWLKDDELDSEDVQVRNARKITMHLQWLGDDRKLELLSQRLYDAGYTETERSFCEAIRNARFCKLKEDYLVPAYVINKLIEFNFLKAKKGKGHPQAAMNLFSEFTTGVERKIDFAKLSYELRERPSQRFQLQLDKAKRLLEELNITNP